ncbi:hypothetical protein GCM10009605_04940 [Nocardiopsis composta]
MWSGADTVAVWLTGDSPDVRSMADLENGMFCPYRPNSPIGHGNGMSAGPPGTSAAKPISGMAERRGRKAARGVRRGATTDFRRYRRPLPPPSVRPEVRAAPAATCPASPAPTFVAPWKTRFHLR